MHLYAKMTSLSLSASSCVVRRFLFYHYKGNKTQYLFPIVSYEDGSLLCVVSYQDGPWLRLPVLAIASPWQQLDAWCKLRQCKEAIDPPYKCLLAFSRHTPRWTMTAAEITVPREIYATSEYDFRLKVLFVKYRMNLLNLVVEQGMLIKMTKFAKTQKMCGQVDDGDVSSPG